MSLGPISKVLEICDEIVLDFVEQSSEIVIGSGEGSGRGMDFNDFSLGHVDNCAKIALLLRNNSLREEYIYLSTNKKYLSTGKQLSSHGKQLSKHWNNCLSSGNSFLSMGNNCLITKQNCLSKGNNCLITGKIV